MSLSTPVAFFIFNRPKLTEIVFEAIAQAKPNKLLVVADGPRFSEEVDKCKKTRAIIEKVDWDCEVLTNFSDKNLKCHRRVRTGLSWVFSQVEEAIILEDDCLPSQSFFRYCENLLERYRNEPLVSSINGSNLGFYDSQYKYSYGFSRYMNMWGWATWKRTFEMIDFEISFWPSFRKSVNFYQALNEDDKLTNFFTEKFDDAYFLDIYNSSGDEGNWDYKWILSNLYSGKLVIYPYVNLVTNLGWGEGATHNKNPEDNRANVPNNKMPFPIIHPHEIKRSIEYDNYFKRAWCHIYPPPTLSQRIKRKIKRLAHKIKK